MPAPAGEGQQLGYDAASNVVSRTLRDNDDTDPADDPVILFGYDNLGRMTSKRLRRFRRATSFETYGEYGLPDAAT